MARLQPGSAEPRPGTGGPGHGAHDQAHTTIGGLNRNAFGVNLEVAAEVSSILDRRAALEHPGLARHLRSGGPRDRGHCPRRDAVGRVLDRFYRNGAIDSDELIEAARTA